MTYNTNTATGTFSFAQRFAALQHDVAEKLAKRKVYRTTLNELRELSDRDLNDLGLSRSMIKGIALEAAYGK
ncbi:MAG: DUF1127 domain-containing protein [Pseudomonadota bacterium]